MIRSRSGPASEEPLAQSSWCNYTRKSGPNTASLSRSIGTSAKPRARSQERLKIQNVPTKNILRKEDSLEQMFQPNEQLTVQRRERIAEALKGCQTWSEALSRQKEYILSHRLAPSGARTLLAHTKAALVTRLPEMSPLEKREWTRAMNALQKRSHALGRVNPPPIPDEVSLAEILRAADGLPSLARLALRLQIVHASRLRTILKLGPRNAMVSPFATSAEEVALKVGRHKTELSTGPYTMHVALDERTRHDLQQVCLARRECEYLFPPTLWRTLGAEIMSALKPLGLQIRSIRPMMLQAMAQLQVPKETMILFSRHTTPQGLDAYLNNGLYEKTEATRMLELSRQLRDNPSLLTFRRPATLADQCIPRTGSDADWEESSSDESL